MIDYSDIYSAKTIHEAEDSCAGIINLCVTGIAASDSMMNVDVSGGPTRVLFETIATLAKDAIERIELKQKAQRET